MTLEPADLEPELEALHGAGFGWALCCCGWDRQEAEDVLQASYVKLFDGTARFGGRSSFQTWLFGVIRRTALERRRSRFVRALALGPLVGDAGRTVAALDSRDSRETQRRRIGGDRGAALAAAPAAGGP